MGWPEASAVVVGSPLELRWRRLRAPSRRTTAALAELTLHWLHERLRQHRWLSATAALEPTANLRTNGHRRQGR